MKLLILTFMYLFFFSFSFISISLISCLSPTRYTPLDNIALDCGSSRRSQTQDRRDWDGDIGNSYIFLTENRNTNSPKSVSISAQKSPSSETIPYSTARISRSEFTYVFIVRSSGPKFIRLHFYPSSYQDFKPSKAFFSVKANDQFTLLSNFSAYLAASSLGEETVEKEFCINVGEERVIKITFTPSNTSSDAYAFINGIEIVSIPTNLYYGSDEPHGFTFIGYEHNLYNLENNTALEMVHRLNVGGRYIAPMSDTGMYRTWKDDVGYINVIGALPVNTSIKLSFTKIHNYTAPDEVYQTARSMGNDKATNEGYNLTWSLPVDSGFTYMVRLHFCEFQPAIMKPGDREFRIYMANQTAEAFADVIVWSGGNGVPVYRDYAVIVNDQGKKQNLSLALHPGSAARTSYSDAILNGIEVFKLSDSTANLAGPDPDPPPSPPSTPYMTNMHVDGTIWIWIVIAVAISLLVLILCTFSYPRMRKRRLEAEEKKRRKEYLRELITSDSFNSANKGQDDGTEGHDLKIISFASIVEATNNFSIENKLGQGGFGPVYKGKLHDEREIAVKRLSRTSGQGLVEFKNELILISKLQHTNLVQVLGCCIHGEEKILIYEYLSNKSLDTYIFDPSKRELLNWTNRLNIIEGIGQGLLYLHKYSRMRVIHRDLKASNVLLDENMNAKISDFGMARIFKQNETEAITMRPVGTYGYMSPEYAMEGTFSVKSDVFSFGVLILEIVSGRRNTSFYDFENRPLNLIGYAWELWKEGTAFELKDPTLGDSCVTNQLLRIIHVGLLCVQESVAHRPTMLDVISMLSNEAMVLAAPKQPAFFTGRNVPDTSSYASKSKDCSVNDLTTSIMEAR